MLDALEAALGRWVAVVAEPWEGDREVVREGFLVEETVTTNTEFTLKTGTSAVISNTSQEWSVTCAGMTTSGVPTIKSGSSGNVTLENLVLRFSECKVISEGREVPKCTVENAGTNGLSGSLALPESWAGEQSRLLAQPVLRWSAASSATTQDLRRDLDRGGNRQLNHALRIVAIARGRCDPATRVTSLASIIGCSAND